MLQFALRNIRIFFRDKAAVFFSLLAVFIVIGLYALFLGDVWVANFAHVPGAKFIMNSWIMAGILAITSLTTTMGAFGTMVDDHTKKIGRDFSASPISRHAIAGGYMLSALVVGVLMSLVALVAAELFILIQPGGRLLSFLQMMKVLGLILLTAAMNTSIVMFIVSFFKSQSAFAAASTVVGTLVGFLTGTYLPVGTLPQGVQYVVKLFPVTYASSLFRQVFLETPLGEAFGAAPAQELDSFCQLMGITMRFGDTTVSPGASILIMAGTAVLFFGLTVFKLRKGKLER